MATARMARKTGVERLLTAADCAMRRDLGAGVPSGQRDDPERNGTLDQPPPPVRRPTADRPLDAATARSRRASGTRRVGPSRGRRKPLVGALRRALVVARRPQLR